MSLETNQRMETYFQSKDLKYRNDCLKYLVLNLPADGKDFFLKAFKKERYLDMKLTAVRGYAAYATEEEVSVLMRKLLELLKKRPQQTPYNYQEYECMRSVFLMPYLIEKYNYECFGVFCEQLEKQYNAMPDCFKNIFTLNEKGISQDVRDPKEVSESWKIFWDQKHKENASKL